MTEIEYSNEEKTVTSMSSTISNVTSGEETFIRNRSQINEPLQKIPVCENWHIQVIGAGLMRTGTTSLKHALEYLYGWPCYHMTVIMNEKKDPAIQDWIEILKLIDDNKISRMKLGANLKKILRGYIATTDYPGCVFYRELMKLYPEAKVILTIRDPEDWLESCRSTVLSETATKTDTFAARLMLRWSNIASFPEMRDEMCFRTLGSAYKKMSDDELKLAYVTWNQSVIETVPKNRLLVYNINEGWKPLCTFLGIELPEKTRSFPHMNERISFQHMLKKRLTFEGKCNKYLLYHNAYLFFLLLLTIFMSTLLFKYTDFTLFK